MAETVALFAVVVVLYLAECVILVPRDALFFVRRRGHHAVRLAAQSFGSRTHAWMLLDPMPFHAETFVCHPWPLAITSSWVARLGEDRELEVERPSKVPADTSGARQLPIVEVRALRRNGEVWFRWASSREASRFKQWLYLFWRAPAKGRDIMLDEELMRRMSVPSVEARVRFVRRAVRLGRMCGSSLFLLVFGVCPILYVFGYLIVTWPAVLAIGLVLHGIVVREHVIACRNVYSLRGAALWEEAGKVAVSPLASMRAAEMLERHALASFEPAAVALVVADAGVLEEVARQALDRAGRCGQPVAVLGPSDAGGLRREPDRDLGHTATSPRRKRGSGPDRRAEFADVFEAALSRLMRRAGLRPGDLAVSPESQDALARSYCPKCREEFVLSEGTCPDCAGVRLRSLDSRASALHQQLRERVERRRRRPGWRRW